MAIRWPDPVQRSQKYGRRPAFASAIPPRIAKIEAISGCNTKRNFIGPVTRSINWSAILDQMWSIGFPLFQVRSARAVLLAGTGSPPGRGTICFQWSLTANTLKMNAVSTDTSVIGKKE